MHVGRNFRVVMDVANLFIYLATTHGEGSRAPPVGIRNDATPLPPNDPGSAPQGLTGGAFSTRG